MAARRTIVCREGIYYLLVVLFIVASALFREENLLVVLAGLMFGPVFFNWRIVTAGLRRLEVARKLPHRICAGDPLLVELIVRNTRTWLAAWTLEVQDTITRLGGSQTDRPVTADVLFPYIAASQSAGVNYRSRLTQRGRYRLGPVVVKTRFPFGLIQSTVTHDVLDELVVCPRLGRLTRRWARLVEAERMGSERSQRRQGFLEGDYYGLREWRAGDSPRWIHWRTSAKLNSLAVQQFEQQRNRNVVLVLDLWQPKEPEMQHHGNVEVAVSFAATAVADLCRRGGNRVLLAIAGNRHQTLTAASASMLYVKECLDQLAVVEADSRNRLPELLAQVAAEAQAGTRQIIISTREMPQEVLDLSPRGQGRQRPERRIWIDVTDEAQTSQLYQLD